MGGERTIFRHRCQRCDGVVVALTGLPLQVHEALLSVFASLDAPVAPSRRGSGHFQSGVSEAEMAQFRSRLLATTRDGTIFDSVCGRARAC